MYILIVGDTPYISQNTCDHKDKRSISWLRMFTTTVADPRPVIHFSLSFEYTYIWRNQFYELTYSHNVFKKSIFKSPLSSSPRESKTCEKWPKCENQVTDLNSVGKQDVQMFKYHESNSKKYYIYIYTI